jgi:hypothetical protein
MMTVFVTFSCDVRYNDDSICNLVMWCQVQWWQYLYPRHAMLGTTWQGYKYCHHCTQHHMTRLQILSSLYLTSHEKVTNTVIIVPDITWQGNKYCHHCTQHHMTRLQILSSLYPTSHDEDTHTVIIVPDITWRGYKYCHHCTWHQMTRLQILSSLYLTPGTMMTVLVTLSHDVGYNDDSIYNLFMWCQVQWWQYL